MRLSVFLPASALLSLGAAGATGPQQLGTISILAQNNLITDDYKTTSAAVLLNVPSNNEQASKSCSDLGEALWSPNHGSFKAGLNQSLAYELYSGRFPADQLFWIASCGKTCVAIGVDGAVQKRPCGNKLPALCTQSAPASSQTFADTSARFQVAQKVGDQTLVGYRDFYNFRFMGVRYAQEPERFTYSKTYHATGTNEALAPAPACLQLPSANTSTDCLFMNIWSTMLPGDEQKEKPKLKHVMIYIHGGGFTTGTASDGHTDGANLASRGDVVTVDITYRLSTLGFLPFNDKVHNGNYWLSDCIAALQWVQQYIHAFGGDASHVTIFGESAGAVSVQKLMESPEAAGLFHGAIMQSNYHQVNAVLESEYNRSTVAILQQTGCNTAADQFKCLQDYDPVKLISLKTISNSPVIDGKYLHTPFLSFNNTDPSARPNYVPTIIGVNRDEGGVLSTFYQTSNLTVGIQDVARSQGLNATAILQSPNLFPLGTGPVPSNQTLDVFNTTTRIYTDSSFRCSSQFIAYGGAKSGKLPGVWFYELNRTYQDPGYDTNGVCQAPKTASHPNGDPDAEYFKCHAGDLFTVFGTIVRGGWPQRDERDTPFSQVAVDYWTSFGRSFDPNPDVGFLKARGYWNTLDQIAVSGGWPKVDAQTPKLMELQWNSFSPPFGEEERCAVLGLPLNSLA